jgi:hypothetical protein
MFLGPVLTEIDLSLRNIAAYQATVSNIQNKQKEIDDMQKRVEQVKRSLLEKREELPEDLDSFDLIHLLSAANANQLIRHSAIFLEPIICEDFLILPVRLSFSTDNLGLSKFLLALEDLENRPTISYLRIAADEITENSQNVMKKSRKIMYNLDVEMTINFYVKGKDE